MDCVKKARLALFVLGVIGLFTMTITIVDKLYRHGSASVLYRKRTFHLGDGKNVYVIVNGTTELRKKEMTVVTIEAIEGILQRTEDCFNSSRTI